jgi:hypothetical protein
MNIAKRIENIEKIYHSVVYSDYSFHLSTKMGLDKDFNHLNRIQYCSIYKRLFKESHDKKYVIIGTISCYGCREDCKHAQPSKKGHQYTIIYLPEKQSLH